MKKACCNCRFYYNEKAECRRNPPHYGTPANSRKWPEIFNDQDSWCGCFKEKVGGPKNYVEMTIVDHKTGMATKMCCCEAPKPGQVTIWELRSDIVLSDDFEIRVDWPLEKAEE